MGDTSKNSYHKRKEKVDFSQKTSSGVHTVITQQGEWGSEESLRKQDTPKISFMNAGITGKPHTRNPHRVPGERHVTAALPF